MAHGIVCDFCSAPNPRWSYKTKDFVALNVPNLLSESIGDWAACDQCHDFIESGDFEGLVNHTIEALLFKQPDIMLADESVLKDLRSQMRLLHAQFVLHRLPGPPEELL
jgi:hypothetical protein